MFSFQHLKVTTVITLLNDYSVPGPALIALHKLIGLILTTTPLVRYIVILILQMRQQNYRVK